jgi:GAF domain-containing protein
MASVEFFARFVAACLEIQQSLDLASTQQSIVTRAAELFGAKGASLMLHQPDSDQLHLSASWGLSQAYLNKGPISARQSLGETYAGQPVIVLDVERDAQVQYRSAAREEGIACIVGLPLAAGGLMVGSLRLYFAAVRHFSPLEMEALKGLAALAGCALKKNYYFSAIKDYTSRIHGQSATVSLKETVQGMLESAVFSVRAKGCALFLWDRKKDTLEVFGSHGLSQRYLAKGPVSAQGGLGEVVQGAPVVYSRTQAQSRLQYPAEAERERIKTIVGLPIVLEGRSVGALRFYFPFEFQPDRDELAWMEHLAQQLGLAVERGRLILKLKDDYRRYLDLLDDLHAEHIR